MNEAVRPGEVFALKDLVAYKDREINRLPLIVNDHMKFMVVSMDEGQGFPDHVAAGVINCRGTLKQYHPTAA